MQAQTITYNTYNYSEHDSMAQEKALNSFIESTEFCYDFIMDDLKEAGKTIGIDIDRIYFSGFWSQGDGACFTGTYEYKKGSVKLAKSIYPNWTDLHEIAETLQELQKPYFYAIHAAVEHRGHYYHELCTTIDVTSDGDYGWLPDTVQENIKEALRGFMQLSYSALEKEYEYQTSEQSFIDYIDCNEVVFLENGEQF